MAGLGELKLAEPTHIVMIENPFENNHRVIRVQYNVLPPEIRAQIDKLKMIMDPLDTHDAPAEHELQAEPLREETPVPVTADKDRSPVTSMIAKASEKAAQAHAVTPQSEYASAHIDEIFAAQAIAATKNRQTIRNHMAVDAEIIRIGIAMNPHTDRDILEMLAIRNEGNASAIAKTRIADLDHAEASLRDSATEKSSVQDLEAQMDPTGITVIRYVTGNYEVERATVVQCLGLMSDVIEKELTRKFHQS